MFLLSLVLVNCEVLSNYKHLRCSVCELLSEQIDKRVAEVNKKTFQTSHRLTKENKIHRNSMKGSELAAVEVLDGICPSLGNCTLKYSSVHGHRIFSNNQDLPKGQFYTTKDRQSIGSLWETGCKTICEELVEYYEDELVDYIKGEDLSGQGICYTTINMCNTDDISDHIKVEQTRQKNQFNKAYKDEF